MAMSKGKKSTSYMKGGGSGGKQAYGTPPMKGGQVQGKGGRQNATTGMTKNRTSGKDHKC